MKFRQTRFNRIFLGALLLGPWLSGCQSTQDHDKEATTLRFFMETNPDPLGRSVAAVVGRSTPFEVTVADKPFLTELHIIEAALVEDMGTVAIRIELDRQGTWILEQYTTANKGKHIAIHSQFGDARWLAAPRIADTISDGVFQFSPDASREETERIVRGLKNVAEQVKKEW